MHERVLPAGLERRCRLIGRLLLVALLAVGAPAVATGAGIETLLMPGKVSSAHAKYESECALCHDRSDKSRQARLCRDCHEDVSADIDAKRGSHGRIANVATTQCKACHSEHLGRDGDILRLDRASFDHHATDFPLEGAHRGLDCASCHTKGQAFRKATTSCGACHKADDMHAGQLGADCGSCHASMAWRGARFDHAKTKFPLRDAHATTPCAACHAGPRYANTPTRCVACHAPDDAHAGSRGEACGECHTTVSWKTARFDHAKETGFALLGRHSGLDCGACHRVADFKDELPRDCVGCHRADDTHALRFGTKCESCHRNDGWGRVDFDHTARTKFVLVGAHARLDCHTCHTAAVEKQKLAHDCAACHRADDPHGGALAAACDSCHSVEKWAEDIRFDHDQSDWPLLGMHALVTCAQCHATRAFKGTPHECLSCHAQNDVHKGGLGKDCAACHSPNGWRSWEFDHAKQTGFALTGAHGRLRCVDCHRQPAGTVKLPQDCASCHRKDDAHLGQYGTQCQRCHTTLTFKGARIQ